ncbi:MAG: helix-turn-helix transcriptional regulator [Sandarakinorhabdus sp.]|nr:helix-turn-helix transcriptional regulator [Sandarakinorhabdus sp.]
MDQSLAVAALGALAQDTRLSVFRLLVRAGPQGMIAGAVAFHNGVPVSTMSHHLAILERAGLVVARRESRHVHYTADFDGMRGLLGFLMDDCCQGNPDLCGNPVALSACEPDLAGAPA